MKTVQDILGHKGGNIWSVAPNNTVYEALQLMAEKEIGAVLVMEADRPVGILSERDYARQVILKGRTSKDTPVSEIMSTGALPDWWKHGTGMCRGVTASMDRERL